MSEVIDILNMRKWSFLLCPTACIAIVSASFSLLNDLSMGSWEQSPFSFPTLYNVVCNYFMMTFISHSFIKVTSTIFSDLLFFFLVDYSALKTFDGLKSEMAIQFWNYLWHRIRAHNWLSFFQTKSITLENCQSQTALQEPPCFPVSLLRLCPGRLEVLTFNPPQQLGWWGDGQWRLPSMTSLKAPPSSPNTLLLFTFLSPQKASRLLQNWNYILNKMTLRHFHLLWSYVVMSIRPVLFYSEKLSALSLRNCYASLGCPGVWSCP